MDKDHSWDQSYTHFFLYIRYRFLCTKIDEMSTECSKHWPLKIVHRWQRMPKRNEFVVNERKGHTVVPYKDAIYVFGGDNGKTTVFNDLLRFDVKKKFWERAFETGTPPSPRSYHSAVVNGSSMFIFGGISDSVSDCYYSQLKNDLFEYNFQTGQWKEWISLGKYKPLPRFGHSAVVYDNKLWIFGGSHTLNMNDMWTMSLSSKEWKEVNQLGDIPPELAFFSVVVTRESMFLFGGAMCFGVVNDLFQFHFNERRWTHISTEHMLHQVPNRSGHTMVRFERHLYVFGGAENFLPNFFNDLYYYDLDTQTWNSIVPSRESQIPARRHKHAATVIGDAMYVFGGEVGINVRSAEMYRFQFASYSKCTLHDDFGRLLRNRLFCDVEFIVGPGKTRMPAHAVIIEARSEFLGARIQQAREKRDRHLKEVQGNVNVPVKDMLEVTLKDAAPLSFAFVLKYIYTDRINPTKILIDETEDPQSIRISRHVTDVYHVAKEFNLKRLAQLCVNYLEEILTHSNVLKVLRNAVDWKLFFLKNICLSVAVKDSNYNAIVMSQEFETLDQTLIVEIVRRRLMS